MGKIIKRTLILLTAVFMVCMTFPATVYAQAKGTKTDPYIMKAGKTMEITWDYYNSGPSSAGIYNKLTVEADGVIRLSFERPYDMTTWSVYDLTLMTESGTKIIGFTTASPEDDVTSTKLTYKIGVKKGTYLLRMKFPAQLNESGYGSSKTFKYVYSFTASGFWESEPNNTVNKADPIRLGSEYSGEFGEEKTADFFSVSLTKGIVYQLRVKGSGDLTGRGAVLKLQSPAGSVMTCAKSGSTVSGSYRIWTFRAETTGKYYFSLNGYTGVQPSAYKLSMIKAPADTMVVLNGKKYCTGKAGKLVSGWKQISSKWYYFDENGMATGWRQISGKWYYFSGKGIMVTGWQKISNRWYYFTSSGAMFTGWKKSSGKWYYLSAGGAMVTGWQKISGTWYYFDKEGVMCTGPQVIGNRLYYFSSSGAMYKGWKKDSGYWFYFGSDGAMVTNRKVTIGGKAYEFLNNGVMYDRDAVFAAAYALVGKTGSCEDMAYQLTKKAFGMGGMSYITYNKKLGHRVSESEVRAGDLIFYTHIASGAVPHVGVYLDGYTSFQGNWLQSDGTRKAVITDYRYSNYWNVSGYRVEFWRVDMDVMDNLDLVFEGMGYDF